MDTYDQRCGVEMLTQEDVDEYLKTLTPLELAQHNATVSAYLLSQFVLLYDFSDSVNSVEILKETADEEEIDLIPLAEKEIEDLLYSLPVYGDA